MVDYQDTYKHKGLRNNLVDLLQQKGISDKLVLEAIRQVPRHFFLPVEFEKYAYEDKAFPIGSGQTISQPYTVAFQTQLLQLKPSDKVLEIGTGSGYQTAVLNACKANIFSIERHEELAQKAAKTLKKISINEVQIRCGDGTLGWAEQMPFDKIIVTAGAPHIPKIYLTQLRLGGFLVIPIGDNKEQKMVRLTKTGESTYKTEVFHTFSFVPLIGTNGWNEK